MSSISSRILQLFGRKPSKSDPRKNKNNQALRSPSYVGNKTAGNNREDTVDRRNSSASDELETSSRRIHRQFSKSSVQAMNDIGKASQLLRDVEDDYDTLRKRADRAVEELIEVKNRLAVMSGEIEKVQAKYIDSIITTELKSGKEEAKIARKKLNSRADKLSEHVASLHGECQQRLQVETKRAEELATKFVFE